jgi:undecaprenyl diphosphate synthase
MNISMLPMLGRGHSIGSAPSHVVLLAEGIERWATKQGIDSCRTLKQSIEALRRAVNAAIRFNIPCLTVDFRSATRYFSDQGISNIFQSSLEEELRDLRAVGAYIRVKGCGKSLGDWGVGHIDECRLELVVCLEYDSRSEIVEAVRRLAREVAGGYRQAHDIDLNSISAKIYASDLPDPDLIIGTLRDQRLSNFLLWQAAYAEFYFLSIDWPEFGEAAFAMAIDDYARRHRRFGGR